MTDLNNPQSQVPQPHGSPPSKGNRLAVAGFVFSLVSNAIFWLPGVNFITWVLGIVFSSIGLNRANRQSLPHRGLAIAGLVIALVPGTVLNVVLFWLIFIA